jgi:hypothetical protein
VLTFPFLLPPLQIRDLLIYYLLHEALPIGEEKYGTQQNLRIIKQIKVTKNYKHN